MVGQRRVVLEYIMVEQIAPERLLLRRQVADREDRVMERRLRLAEPGRGVAPPIVDQDVEGFEPLHMMPPHRRDEDRVAGIRSEEHTSELQSLMRISYAVFCLKKKK